MNTESLLHEVVYMFDLEKQHIKRFNKRAIYFASKMVEHNDIPDMCKWCYFSTWKGVCVKPVIGYEHMPVCTVYDFLKYLLRVV